MSTSMTRPASQRKRLHPFLRKPLRVILEEERHPPPSTNEGADASSNDDNVGLELSRRNNKDHGEDPSRDNYDSHGPSTRRRSPPPRHLTLFDLVSIGVG